MAGADGSAPNLSSQAGPEPVDLLRSPEQTSALSIREDRITRRRTLHTPPHLPFVGNVGVH
eukprot:2368284-Alexandrium_andersonii.AAC.1